MEWLIALAGGVLAGICGGLFGIGGGIVMVPFLIVTLGFAQKKAQGTSLVALLAPVGLLALTEYYKSKNVDFKIGGFLALGFVVGAWGGSKIAVGLSDEMMRKGFSVFLVAVGIYMFFKK